MYGHGCVLNEHEYISKYNAQTKSPKSQLFDKNIID